MEKSDNIKNLTADYIKKLELVKAEFIQMKRTLAVSIRKDYVKIELKDILAKSNNYEELQENLNNYIEEILEKENSDYDK